MSPINDGTPLPLKKHLIAIVVVKYTQRFLYNQGKRPTLQKLVYASEHTFTTVSGMFCMMVSWLLSSPN